MMLPWCSLVAASTYVCYTQLQRCMGVTTTHCEVERRQRMAHE